MNKSDLGLYCEIMQISEINTFYVPSSFPSRSVSDLTKFLSYDECLEAVGMMDPRKTDEEKYLNIQGKVCTNEQTKSYEDVCDLTGIAITAWLEYQRTNPKTCYIFDTVRYKCNINKNIIPDWKWKDYNEILHRWDNGTFSFQDCLHIANIHVAIESGYLSRLMYLRTYDWISDYNLGMMMKRLECIKGDVKFECEVFHQGDPMNGIYYSIAGRIDIVETGEENIIWEIKCVDNLMSEHILQLAQYAVLWENNTNHAGKNWRYKLLNIRTNQIYEISINDRMRQELLPMLCRFQARSQQYMTEEQFLAKMMGKNIDDKSGP